MLAQEIIRRKRDGLALSLPQLQAFVDGLVDGSWSDSQAAALAMAVVCRGMNDVEATALTRAMTASGEVMDWAGAQLDGPVLDKHSTGGVGDKVSLILAPVVAACGGVVPMISGRGLGHTGGTLDKLEALPGYRVDPGPEALRATLRACGCAIIGASDRLAPADRRLYAIRDVTATVESVPLITASILCKKLAAGLQGLVMDVKVGNGAFTPTLGEARGLASSLVSVAARCGLRAAALITDMQQPLGSTAGNALEVREAQDFLTGHCKEARLQAVTEALSARLLRLGGLAADDAEARRRVRQVLDSGAAAERWARMVAALGGPADVLRDARLPMAGTRLDVPAPRAGTVAAIDTRSLGLAVVELGGGRSRPGQAVNPAVGLSGLRALGARMQRGDALATVHAADTASAQRAALAVASAFRLADDEPAADAAPLIVESIDPPGP